MKPVNVTSVVIQRAVDTGIDYITSRRASSTPPVLPDLPFCLPLFMMYIFIFITNQARH